MPITNPIKCRKSPASFLATLLLGNLAEEEKNGNAKDVKTRQTCRYQDGDVPPTTTQMTGREAGGGWRDDNGKRKKERSGGRERKGDGRDNRVEQVGKTLKRAANAFIATLDSTLA